MDDNVVIALFRHGLTVDNKRGAYLGWTDSPLLDEEAISEQDEYNIYFSSDLNRCLRTLSNMWPDAKPLILPEMREMNFGDWEGFTYEDLKDLHDYKDWLASPFSKSPSNGETFDQFSKRITLGWSLITKQVVEAEVSSAAVVTHGGVIRYLLSKYAPEEKDFWEWKVPHGVGYELVFDLERLRSGDRCILLREVPLTANEHG